MIPDQVIEWIAENDFGEVINQQAVGGGCINNGLRLNTTSERTFFLKTNSRAPGDMFLREGEGLNALMLEGAPRVPQPFLVGARFLLLEDLEPRRSVSDYWIKFGRQLAALHEHTGPSFGFNNDNYIGSTPQSNKRTQDGFLFFAEQRLSFQTRLACRDGLLSKSDEAQVMRIIDRLEDLIPLQPPSLIHGDLWSGNAITDNEGQPAIIDPATHYGWAEAELAMTVLFGGFPETFYQAYEEVRPLSPGYRGRFPIYNLYHLLNHLNLFGGGYLGRTKAILARYS